MVRYRASICFSVISDCTVYGRKNHRHCVPACRIVLLHSKLNPSNRAMLILNYFIYFWIMLKRCLFNHCRFSFSLYLCHCNANYPNLSVNIFDIHFDMWEKSNRIRSVSRIMYAMFCNGMQCYIIALARLPVACEKIFGQAKFWKIMCALAQSDRQCLWPGTLFPTTYLIHSLILFSFLNIITLLPSIFVYFD